METKLNLKWTLTNRHQWLPNGLTGIRIFRHVDNNRCKACDKMTLYLPDGGRLKMANAFYMLKLAATDKEYLLEIL